MTRRYVRQISKSSIAQLDLSHIPPSFLRKQPAKKQPEQPLDLSAIPAEFLRGHSQPAKKSKLPARTPVHKLQDCVDEPFKPRRTNSRLKRAKRQPLNTFDDRLAKLWQVKREDGRDKFNGMIFELTQWSGYTTDPDQRDVNIHLPALEDDKLSKSVILSIKLVSKPNQSDYLIDTPAGRVCPHCKTNEFIRSDLRDKPKSYQDANWRRANEFGEHCEQCRCVSQPSI